MAKEEKQEMVVDKPKKAAAPIEKIDNIILQEAKSL